MISHKFNVSTGFPPANVNYSQGPHPNNYDPNTNNVGLNFSPNQAHPAQLNFYAQAFHRDMMVFPNPSATANGSASGYPPGVNHSAAANGGVQIEFPVGNSDSSPKESKFNPAAKSFTLPKNGGTQFDLRMEKWNNN